MVEAGIPDGGQVTLTVVLAVMDAGTDDAVLSAALIHKVGFVLFGASKTLKMGL